MTTGNRTSVMLVDDHSIMRDLLRDALENTGEFEVVAQAADGQEALRVVQEAAPDVIVMDVIMPVMDGIEACRADHRTAARYQGAHADCLQRAGRHCEGDSRRGHRLPAEVFRQGAARAVRGPLGDGGVERLAGLTDREVEILKQFAAGLSYQEIGDVREISALTVRNAVSGVQKKLGFRTRQQMVVWAIRAGVVDDASV